MQNVVADLAVESEAATVLALRLAAAVDDLRRPARGGAAPDRAAAGQVLGLQAHAGADGRGARVPRRQRLRRGVADAAPLPRGAAQLGLGGVRQRQRPRRAPRAVPRARGAGRLDHRGRPGPRRRRPARPRRSTTPWPCSGRCWATPPALEVGARRLAGRMAAVLQGSLLVRFSPPEVADVFCASRLGTSYDGTFGALDGGDLRGIVDRTTPTVLTRGRRGRARAARPVARRLETDFAAADEPAGSPRSASRAVRRTAAGASRSVGGRVPRWANPDTVSGVANRRASPARITSTRWVRSGTARPSGWSCPITRWSGGRGPDSRPGRSGPTLRLQAHDEGDEAACNRKSCSHFYILCDRQVTFASWVPRRARRRRRQRRAARRDGGRPARTGTTVELLDIARRGGRLRPPGHHDRRPLLGQRHAADGAGGASAVPDLRQARPVLGAAPVLPVRAARSSTRWRPRAFPWRTEAEVYRSDLARPAARRADDAPGAGRLRPRRAVGGHLARGGAGPRPATWDLDRLRARGLPARPARRQPRGRAAGGAAATSTWKLDDLRRRPARGGGACPMLHERRDLAAPAGARRFDDELASGCARPAASACAWRAEARRPPPCSATATPAPTTCWPASRRRPRDDRLRLLGRRAGRLRPRPAARRRHPDRHAAAADDLAEIDEADRRGVRRGAARRGLRRSPRQRPTCPRAAACCSSPACRRCRSTCSRARSTPETIQHRGRPGRDRPLQPRPAGRRPPSASPRLGRRLAGTWTARRSRLVVDHVASRRTGRRRPGPGRSCSRSRPPVQWPTARWRPSCRRSWSAPAPRT